MQTVDLSDIQVNYLKINNCAAENLNKIDI